MAGLVEAPAWADDIYQIEKTDPVIAGPPNLAQGKGIANVPHAQLANRTSFLKSEVARLEAILNNITNGAPDALNTLTELAAAMADSESVSASIMMQLGVKLGPDDFATPTEAVAGQLSDKIISPSTMTLAITAALSDLSNGAPEALDTLNELAAALGDDENFAATMTAALASKLPAADFNQTEIMQKLKGVASRQLRVSTGSSAGAGTEGYWCRLASIDMSTDDLRDVQLSYSLGGTVTGVPAQLNFSVLARQSFPGAAQTVGCEITTAFGYKMFAPDCLKVIGGIHGDTVEIWVQKTIAHFAPELFELTRSQSTGVTVTYPEVLVWQAEEPEDITGGTSVRSRGVAAFGAPIGVPVGTILPMLGSACPDGCLPLSGMEHSRALYPQLWTWCQTSGRYDATGANPNCFGPGSGGATFTTPDLRAMSLKGWDNGRGIDVGRALSDVQQPQVGEFDLGFGTEGSAQASDVPTGWLLQSTMQNIVNSGLDNRVLNAAVNFCVKY